MVFLLQVFPSHHWEVQVLKRSVFDIFNEFLLIDLFMQIIVPSNTSALIEYNKYTNSYASVREYLMVFIINLPITTTNSIKLQASSLVQLTQATNQLTRISSVNDFFF